jgi:hypothetical protein
MISAATATVSLQRIVGDCAECRSENGSGV